jgi:sugar transferase (PEP-CTERM/EpsH1 system associated)
MRDLLFLAHRMPYPPDKGDKIRAFHVLRHLARNFRIHLGCFSDDPNDARYVERLGEHCASLFVAPLSRRKALARGLYALASGDSLSEGYFRDGRMTRWVAETMARVDPENIFVFCSSMVPYATPYAATHRVIADMVDVDSEKWRAYGQEAAWPLHRLYARESRALLALERRAAMLFERSLFVSREEADVFLRAAPETAGRVGFFQNGVDLDYFDASRVFANPFVAEAAPIVFTGTMDYRPNIEGVEWFARQILPLVRRNHPKAEFWIVGSYPSARVTKLAQSSAVRVTGRVADVRPYLAHAACVVAPLHIARGLQNKVLEAMAMARPVVATPAACEGLSAKAGQDLLLAETADAFAGAVSLVIAAGLQDLGHQARLCVESGYNWSRNLKVLDELFQSTNDRADMPEAAPCGGQETIVMRAVS